MYMGLWLVTWFWIEVGEASKNLFPYCSKYNKALFARKLL